MIARSAALPLLTATHYRFYDTRRKGTLDALRIAALNMFTHLLTFFRPLDDNRRNDHAMLRNLTRAGGFLRRVTGMLHVELWLKGRFQPAQLRVFEHFPNEISGGINERVPPRHDRIRIALHDAPPGG